MPLNIFISYAHKDEAFKDALIEHLRDLENSGLIQPWTDRVMEIGDEWQKRIQEAMQSCHMALFLVSSSFNASSFIRARELPTLLERWEKEGIDIVPIIIRPCRWNTGPLGKFLSLPKDGEPVNKHTKGSYEWDKAWTDIAEAIAKKAEKFREVTEPDAFVTAYRKRFHGKFQKWDLAHTGVVQAGGAGAPIEAGLEEMYTPLRMGEEYDIEELDHGAIIAPDDLKVRKKPLIVKGIAGSGKTTWLRWTFRRMLSDPEVLPLFVELRTLAKNWSEVKPGERSLDHFLATELADNGLPDRAGDLTRLLKDQNGPRPVLLVDGWDELGEIGKAFRDKLMGFLKAHPRVLAVATSRPYGEGRPSQAENFETLEIQPLNDEEIRQLSDKFFRHCDGQDGQEHKRSMEGFLAALTHSQDAQTLARTALLLTMMLLISRHHPLPDKRHKLYQVCIENLLTALPKRKEEQGARIGSDRWRPKNSDERMRAVARMAYHAKGQGGEDDQGRIVRTWEELEKELPQEWTHAQRQGFLLWLAGPAGLLNDRSDGTLVFVHLSFQEFLSAWHLNATVEGDENRARVFLEHSKDQSWWETLRLWGALVETANPSRMEPVFQQLIEEKDSGLWCAGAMMADGLGATSLENWSRQAADRVVQAWSEEAERCFQAWGASRQEAAKKTILKNALDKAALNTTWLSWFRFKLVTKIAYLDPPPTSQHWSAGTLLSAMDRPILPKHWAIGRILSGVTPHWPGLDEPCIPLLQLWPGQRRLAGIRLQSFASLNTNRSTFLSLSKKIILLPIPMHEIYEAEEVAWHSPPTSSHEITNHFIRKNIIRYTEITLASKMTYDYKDLEIYNFIINLDLSEKDSNHIDFAIIEQCSLNRVGLRVLLAQIKPASPLLALFHHAAKVSVGYTEHMIQLKTSLKNYQGDPLWPALARHVARCSTNDDKKLLENLAQNPEQREAPLQWGLKYIVRGDVMLNDGSEITLDEICDEHGLERLPYLEEMPPEPGCD
ncbi:MAG: TIR domain-containing protein [Magnetococcales bacterium]|nr:TIR domain-containing protein [Magnetococcales bacterium]